MMEISEAREILRHIPCGSLSYQEWTNVGAALHHEGLPCSLWEEWSATDKSRYHAGECEKKWRSFGNYGGTNVTMGSVVHMAQEYGWSPLLGMKTYGWDDLITSDDEKSAGWHHEDTVQDLRIPIARLSLGREKLFLRYVTEQGKVDLSAAQEALKRQFGVDVSLWAMGPRDEVSELGGLGPCGRVCCCNSWQRRYPSRLAPDRRSGSSLPSLMNGTCGRFKCCLAFERY